MRRSLILAGLTVATLVASIAGAFAQQPMPRVQIGVLECRGGASVGAAWVTRNILTRPKPMTARAAVAALTASARYIGPERRGPG